MWDRPRLALEMVDASRSVVGSFLVTARERSERRPHGSLDLTMAVYRKPIAARQQAAVEELDARLSGKVVEIRRREESA